MFFGFSICARDDVKVLPVTPLSTLVCLPMKTNFADIPFRFGPWRGTTRACDVDGAYLSRSVALLFNHFNIHPVLLGIAKSEFGNNRKYQKN